MRKLIIKPFLLLAYLFRFIGVVGCLIMIQVSNAFGFLFARKNKKSEAQNTLNSTTFKMPDIGRKMQQSFR